MPNKKMGRPPAENPKDMRVDVRLTKEELELLDAYCSSAKVSRPQAMRNAILLLAKTNDADGDLKK